jgi:hypothetical protein
MTNFENWANTLDRAAEERQLSRYDQLLLDAAEVQLLLGNLGAAGNLISKMNDYEMYKTFQNLKQVEAY